MINIMLGSIILAIWGVTLFFGKTIGLLMLLFALPFTVFTIYILEKNKKVVNKNAKLLIVPITLLSATYCLYNNSFFNTFNIIIIPILTIIMVLDLFGENFEFRFKLIEKVLTVIFESISFIGENIEKIRKEIEEKFKINLDTEKSANRKRIIRAILITIPITLFIIMLLSSADDIFGKLFINIADIILEIFRNIKISTLIVKLILTCICFVYFVCFFEYITYRYEIDNVEEKKKTQKDDFTIKMILTSLNIIYLFFCII